jgi:hypothetical protein
MSKQGFNLTIFRILLILSWVSVQASPGVPLIEGRINRGRKVMIEGENAGRFQALDQRECLRNARLQEALRSC